LFAASPTSQHPSPITQHKKPPPPNATNTVPDSADPILPFFQGGSAAVYNSFDLMKNRPRFNNAGVDSWWRMGESDSPVTSSSN